ncbi:MAG: polysaccharide deacetylase family protein [Myxococcales bacterium]|nr:polysaccharide deacetylase family protein [Myxococcales bacterium]
MLAAVSIDMDGLDLYCSIHGIAPPNDPNVIYNLAMDRFLDLFEELQIKATFFVVTRYFGEHGAEAQVKKAFLDGHEIASHTHNHPYNLPEHAMKGMRAEIDLATQAIESLTGKRPVGFRAPGYNICDPALDHLERNEYRYDSSVFPCPPYYAAKAAVMGLIALRGGKSGSALTDPRALLAPIHPYQPARKSFHRRSRSDHRELWEIPICVAPLPLLRFHVIGTTLALLGPGKFAPLYSVLRRTHKFLNLEFHGIDLLGPDDLGVPEELVARQPDLRIGWAQKRATYKSILQKVARDYDFVTLEEGVERLEASRGSASR